MRVTILKMPSVVVVAFGIVARIALSSIIRLRRGGLKVGLFRPITLFPFPEKEIFFAFRRKQTFYYNRDECRTDGGRCEVVNRRQIGSIVLRKTRRRYYYA